MRDESSRRLPTGPRPKALPCVAAGCPHLRHLVVVASPTTGRPRWAQSRYCVAHHASADVPAPDPWWDNSHTENYSRERGRYTHRRLMEQVIGRPLMRSETVHHRNGDKRDNRPENLELWVGVQPHGARRTDLPRCACSCCICQCPACARP